MAIADRKQRAFEARERLIVDHADELLLDRGYLGLNLDELADRVEYSKATLYHHFVSKEDLILAVVDRHFSIRLGYFERASRFKGLPRERIFAFGIADRLLSRQFPHGFPLVQLIRQPSVWAKCSEQRQQQYLAHAEPCFSLAVRVVEDGIRDGHLTADSLTPDEVVWGLVSLSKGAHLIFEEGFFDSPEAGEQGPLHCLFDNYHRFLDGVGWRPLVNEYDYPATRKRIEAEVYGKEFAEMTNA